MTQKGATPSIDMEKAIIDPGSVFSTPEDVEGHTDLTQEEKIEILRRWEYDAAEGFYCPLWKDMPLRGLRFRAYCMSFRPSKVL